MAIFHEKAMSNCKLTWQLSVFPVYPRRASIRTLIGVYYRVHYKVRRGSSAAISWAVSKT